MVSWKVLEETPWDQTEVKFEGVTKGWHTLVAYATDPLNGTDTSGATHQFYVDNAAPTSAWWESSSSTSSETTSRPFGNDGMVTSLTEWESVGVSCNDDNPVVDCREVAWMLKGIHEDWQTEKVVFDVRTGKFSMPLTLDGGDGAKNILVRSTDGVGNVEQPPYGIDVTVTVDTIPPVVKINPAFKIKTLDGDRFFTKIDGGSLTLLVTDTTNVTLSCRESSSSSSSSSSSDCSSGTLTTFSSSSDGLRTIIVTATDQANLTTTASYSFTVDRVPPVLTIDASEFLGDTTGRNNITWSDNDKDVWRTSSDTLKMTFSDTDTSPTTYTCSSPDATFTSCDAGAILLVTATKNGLHALTITSTDAAGHETTRTLRWYRDTSKPSCALVDNKPRAEYLDATEIELHVTCVDDDDFLTFQWSLQPFTSASGSTSACDSPPPVLIPAGDQGMPLILSTKLSPFVEQPGSYEVVVVATDRSGNVKSVITDDLSTERRKVKIKVTARNPPTGVQLRRNINGSITLTWEPPRDTAATTRLLYHVEYTTDPKFPEEQTTKDAWSFQTNIPSLSLLLVPGVDIPSEVPTLDVLRAHVRTTTSGEQDWSLPTPTWTTARDCDPTEEYLVDDCENGCLENPTQWSCTQCPQGASCSGPVLWSGVRAKFGHWRVYDAPNVTRDIEVRRKIFRPCMYAPACLGATTDDESLRGKYWVVLGKYDNLTHVTNNSGTAMAAAGITVFQTRWRQRCYQQHQTSACRRCLVDIKTSGRTDCA